MDQRRKQCFDPAGKQGCKAQSGSADDLNDKFFDSPEFACYREERDVKVKAAVAVIIAQILHQMDQ